MWLRRFGAPEYDDDSIRSIILNVEADVALEEAVLMKGGCWIINDENHSHAKFIKQTLVNWEKFPSEINPAVNKARVNEDNDIVTWYMYCTHVNCPTTFHVHLHLTDAWKKQYLDVEVVFPDTHKGKSA